MEEIQAKWSFEYYKERKTNLQSEAIVLHFSTETNIPAQDPNVSSPIQHKVQIFTTKVDRNLTDLRTKMQ